MKTVICVFLCLLFPLILAADNLSMTVNTNAQLNLHFELGNYQMNLTDSKTPVVMQETTDNFILNNYSLPLFNYLVQIPNHSKAVITINNSKFITQEHVKLSVIDKDLPMTDDLASVSAPFVMRNNILSTLMIQPFVYNDASQSMQILVEADIQIDFVPDNTVSLSKEIRQTKQFKEWLSKSVINYRDNSRTGEANGSFLVFYNQTASALSYIQPLLDWKHQKGWEVHAVNTLTIGNNITSIKNYIQNAYDTWANPPEYILMVGRATSNNYVPTFWEMYNYNTVGDYQYCLLDGNDIIPDAFIGRFSFSTVTQLSAMINKTIGYEKMTDVTNFSWYSRAILCPDNTDSGPSCTTTIDYVKDLITDYEPATQFSYINSGTLSTQMMNAMNQGASNFYYRGHNGYSGLTNSNISNLVNTGKYPFICFITCFSGNYGTYTSNCIGDQFMRVGTATSPMGGVGFIGAACETHTCLNNIMTGAIAYGFYKDGLTNQGQALQRSKIGLLACYPQYPDDYIPQNFQSVNLLGDPTVDIWLKEPIRSIVNYSATVPLSNGTLPVVVTDLNGIPAANVKVCLLKGSDEIFQTGFTDENGTFIFSWNTVTAGTGKITVTNPNYCTYQGTVTFASQTSAFTLSNATSFSQLDSGTSYSFPISITNNQYTALTGVTAVLTSSSGEVLVTNGNLAFGSMNQNQTVASTQNAMFSLSEACAAGEAIAFKLHIQGTYNSNLITYDINFQVNENGHNFIITNAIIGTDNVLTPGETSQFTVTLKNVGTEAANNISVHLSCPNPNITITAATQSFPNMAGNATGSNSTAFGISANQAIYVGTPVNLVLAVSYNNGSAQTLVKEIVIGNALSSSMTGPDAYGYICVANSDSHPLAQPYSWIEINPSLGGTGTALTLADSDTNGSGSYATVSLPFSFRYYGIMYNQITICSNGFIMPGSEGSQEWMNWEIPGPMVPKPIIAPFWDDLIIQTASKIAYKYDSVNNAFIVEWSQLKNRYDVTQTETFEVVIYDALHYATPTGDNAFLFQYNSFHNVDAGNYGVDNVDHGQYATVGIADHSGMVGLEYTYQCLYPTTATTLANNKTLYFTTMANYSAGPLPVVLSCPFTETTAVYPNNQIDSGETITLAPIITNSGYGILKNSTLLLSTSDPYISITNPASSLVEILPNGNASVNTPFVIAVASNCPNMRQISFYLQYTTTDGIFNSEFSLIVHAPQVSFVSCLVNGGTNPILNPDTTVPVIIQIQNMSNLPIQNGSFTLQQNANWTATPNQFNCNIPALSTIDLNFNLHILANAVIGDELPMSGLFNIPATYDSLFTMQLMIGSWNDLVMETFDAASLGNWDFSTGIGILASNHIHETGSEIVITPTGTGLTYQFESPLINGRDCQRVQVGFTYCNFNPTVTNAIYVSYNQGETWNSLFTFNTVQTTPIAVSFDIEDIPANMQTMKFKWVTVTQSDNANQIVLDDIRIQAIHHIVGYLSGTVSLESFPTNITQVTIASPYLPDQHAHPDASGHFLLPLYQGMYPVIKAELANYMPQILSNMVVVSNQTTGNINFVMSYLQKPVNLDYSVNGNNLSLSWNLEGVTGKSENRMLPDYYRIFLINNSIVTTDTTSSMNYACVLASGDYTIYAKSVFLDTGNNEVVSDSSNVLQIINTGDHDGLHTPYIFALNGNYPNPFNPTTTISYSIKLSGRTSLRIFNIKGQLVNTLVDEIQAPGKYSVSFNGLDSNRRQLASGVYLYRLYSGNQSVTDKMILMK